MRIGIDARVVYNPVLKGIGVYLYNLLSRFNDSASQDEFFLFFDSRQPRVERLSLGPHLKARGISIRKGDRFHLWEQLSLPAAIKREKIDVFHSVANTTCFIKSCPTVVTVHDTKPFELAQAGLFDKFYFKKFQPWALRSCERIICPSEFTKRRVLESMKVPESRVVVIYQGLSEMFGPVGDEAFKEKCRARFDIGMPFILSVGGETPLKNITNLLEAFARLKRKKDIPHKLVITGIRDPKIKAQHLEHIERLGIIGDVSVLGYVENEDLVALYNLAALFVYPSLFEGFGFPPLEAMACGVPVAASNATSIPEVVGDAALLFDGRVVEDMSDKMYGLLSSPELQQSLRARGLKRVTEFKWEDTAKKTLEVYRSVLP